MMLRSLGAWCPVVFAAVSFDATAGKLLAHVQRTIVHPKLRHSVAVSSDMSALQLAPGSKHASSDDSNRSSFAHLWTVVHNKKDTRSGRLLKEAEALVAILSEEPAQDPTVKDQIWEMGKELCKDRPDDPQCEMFKDKAAQLEAEAPAPAAKTSPAPAQSAKVAHPAPAPSPAKSPAPATPKPIERAAPAQGFSGKKVEHIDGQTMSRDWHDEYEVPPDKKQFSVMKSTGRRAASHMVLFAASAMVAVQFVA